jgi:anti-sigma regulatory factor (Ser/Thr protein kinase)
MPKEMTLSTALKQIERDLEDYPHYVYIFEPWCKGCEICVALCPQKTLEMGRDKIDEVKMAVAEACINAFEHSGDRDGRVRLWFAVTGGRLVIRVENRGRALAGLPAAAAPGEQPRRRGWGLTLMRQLIDEVRIEPREDGVSLVMEKDIGGQSHG